MAITPSATSSAAVPSPVITARAPRELQPAAVEPPPEQAAPQDTVEISDGARASENDVRAAALRAQQEEAAEARALEALETRAADYEAGRALARKAAAAYTSPR